MEGVFTSRIRENNYSLRSLLTNNDKYWLLTGSDTMIYRSTDTTKTMPSFHSFISVKMFAACSAGKKWL